MYLTKKEIFSQYEALDKTFDYLVDKSKKISDFRKNHNFSSLTFIGSGSSYCLCQSAELSTKMLLGIPANSIPAGDLMLNFPHYRNLIKETMLVVPSRSGSTSEVIRAVKRAREEFNIPCISISAKEESDLSDIVDLSLEIPWVFDESVCQTRTVTNLYTANLFLLGVLADNSSLINEIREAIDRGQDYILQYKDLLKDIAQNHSWDKVIVLADSELQGIADEGAIAFKEIPQVPSNYYHLLDVRHGPMVLVDDQTLVIMGCSPFGLSYQHDLIEDLQAKGASVVTVGPRLQSKPLSELHITVPVYNNYGVMGIPFIFVPQVIAYFKAVDRGINPDKPGGLEPWIEI